MKYCISAKITPLAATKLLLTGEMDLSDFSCCNQIEKVWECLLEMPIEQILHIVDCNLLCEVADVKCIPQFGRIETLNRVPYYFCDRSTSSADYAQLGFYLKNDLSATLDANIKYGENNGKGASLLGIVNCMDKRIVPSVLTESFCTLSSEKQQEALLRLLFRIPIIQILLQKSRVNKVCVYEPMSLLKESTQFRRGQCIKSIVKALNTLDSNELRDRLNNIYWE